MKFIKILQKKWLGAWIWGLLSLNPLLSLGQEGPDCNLKSGLVRYQIEPSQGRLGQITLFYFEGNQREWKFKETATLDISSEGDARLKGLIEPVSAGEGIDDWILDIRFRYEELDQNSGKLHLNTFKILANSKLINRSDRHQIMFIRPLKDGDRESKNFQIFEKAKSASLKEEKDLFAVSTFEYNRPDGQWRQGSFRIRLNLTCHNLQPLSLDHMDSDRPGYSKWKIKNNNSEKMHLKWHHAGEAIQLLNIPSQKKGGEKIIYLSDKNGQAPHLHYAFLPGLGGLEQTCVQQECAKWMKPALGALSPIKNSID